MVKRSGLFRSGLAVSAAALLFALSACAAAEAPGAPPADGQGTGGQSAVEPGSSDDVVGGDGDYAFGTDRDQIAFSIGKAFSTKNGSARWDGDTLVLSVDGDVDDPLAGFTECRVMKDLLTESDLSAVEYPNGRVECSDVLGE